MTVLDLYQQAQSLNPEERKTLINTLMGSLDNTETPQTVEVWQEGELEALLIIDPLRGADIIAQGLTGGWADENLSDGETWQRNNAQNAVSIANGRRASG